jgi:predicted TIM-barrel fold metal-dependent hydrolase
VWDNAKNPKNLNLGGIADGPLCTYLSKDYLSGAGSLPVASAVHVETVVGQDGSFFIDTVAESRFVLADTASAFGQRPVGVVAFVDLSKDDAGAVLDAHAAALGKAFRGVRMILNHSPTWPQVPHARFVGGDASDPAAAGFFRGFSLLAARGLTFDFHANPSQFLGAAAVFARAPAGARIVIDHLGCPKLSGDAAADAEAVGTWKTGMRALAALPHVFVKISGLEYVLAGWLVPASKERETAAALVRWVLSEFGAARCMVASNFPVDLHMGGPAQTMPALYAALHAIMAPVLDHAQLRAVFHDNAFRFYGLGDARA